MQMLQKLNSFTSLSSHFIISDMFSRSLQSSSRKFHSKIPKISPLLQQTTRYSNTKRHLQTAFVRKSHETSKLKAFIDSPAGPKTIHFWAPAWKWMLVFATVGDYFRPANKLSIRQSASLTATGIIWSRYSFVIVPVNYRKASKI